MKGKIAIGTLVTVAAGVLTFLGYFYTQINSNINAVFADYNTQQQEISTEDSNYAALNQKVTDIDNSVTSLNNNVANVESAQGQILQILRK